MKMGAIRKLIVALVGAVIAALAIFGIGDGETLFGVGQEVIVSLVIGVLTAIGVYAVPNDPPAQ